MLEHLLRYSIFILLKYLFFYSLPCVHISISIQVFLLLSKKVFTFAGVATCLQVDSALSTLNASG
ncbi:hypothetical protein EVA_10767 [gut metagenome]|uniref:Uncharacterized protein n=1 Tax=gut metagenome TaxID=749906 RepID=J9GH20_9ZZZZ